MPPLAPIRPEGGPAADVHATGRSNGDEPYAAAVDRGDVVTTGPEATHLAACHNQPTPDEAKAGRPLRDGFIPAPPPGTVIEQLAETAEPAAEAELVIFTPEEGPQTTAPGAGALPLPPEERDAG